MSLIKLIRQPILGQQILGIDLIAIIAGLRLPDDETYASSLFPAGAYVAQRSNNDPYYNYGLIDKGIQEAYANQDALGKIFILPTFITQETAFPRTFLLRSQPPIIISGAILEIAGNGNDNSEREFPLLYGTLTTHIELVPRIPRNQGFAMTYIAPTGFAEWFNTFGPQDTLIVGSALPVDYIKYVRLRFLQDF